MSGDATDFLYPFIESDERDVAGLLTDLAASADAKMAESRALVDSTLAASEAALGAAARDLASCFAAGGRLFCFGNGGSATDAAAAARLFTRPRVGRPLPAHDLAGDPATLTAIANDVGFELVFARQLMAHARRHDAALAFSTSGNSPNLLAAMREARRRGLTTVAVCGTGGGRMAASDDVDHCLVVACQSVHRVQEAQRAMLLALWRRTCDELVARP